MNINRAKQIISSPAEIDVQYHGVSVWLQNVNEEAATVRVHSKDNPDDERDVNVEELNELS
ncbi:H-type small acid-soluble spore protein [Pseudalkalibacillus caeni]|uniref:H-type small acid-soluble spore protein n=1 Tax=Exobacillus caeni TaxID=2574798 RepID=A0A5R9FAK5_9BACL|nr:H-type small acid-soluble spore protein [Pseudalkalibacillus caeni]TLS37903.1 H-type small acid-soluble spore protein [Pseudalkalibacillus caeni]